MSAYSIFYSKGEKGILVTFCASDSEKNVKNENSDLKQRGKKNHIYQVFNIIHCRFKLNIRLTGKQKL
jgi:hypothetical protein